MAFGLYNNISAKKGFIEELREVIGDLIEENNSLREESGELKNTLI
jgi:regulator of replication initiation timing